MANDEVKNRTRVGRILLPTREENLAAHAKKREDQKARAKALEQSRIEQRDRGVARKDRLQKEAQARYDKRKEDQKARAKALEQSRIEQRDRGVKRLAEQVSSPMISATKATKDKLQPIPDMDRPIPYKALQEMKKQETERKMDEGMEEGVENHKKRKLASGGLIKNYKKGGMVSRGSGCVSRSKKTKYR